MNNILEEKKVNPINEESMNNDFIKNKIMEEKKIKEVYISQTTELLLNSEFMDKFQALIKGCDMNTREIINILKEVFARSIKELRKMNKIERQKQNESKKNKRNRKKGGAKDSIEMVYNAN